MRSVGERLRRERVERGIALPQLAAMTRISRNYLEAIEAGNTDELPSGFFYRSFVRQYATALGLDTAALEAELERVRAAEAPTLEAALQKAEFPLKRQDPIVTESNRRYLGSGRIWVSVALLASVLVGCSAFYAWWGKIESASASRGPETAHAVQVASAPQTRLVQAPTSAPPAVDPPAAQTAAIRQDPPLAPATSQPAPVSVATPVPPADPAQTPAVPKTPSITPDDHVIVQVSATELTWVSVSADGKYVFSGLLQPKQSVTLGGKERAQLKIGNAAGVAVSWNGHALGAVGHKGQVRTVLLTPESYRIIAPEGSL